MNKQYVAHRELTRDSLAPTFVARAKHWRGVTRVSANHERYSWRHGVTVYAYGVGSAFVKAANAAGFTVRETVAVA